MFKKKKDDFVNPFADDSMLDLQLEESAVTNNALGNISNVENNSVEQKQQSPITMSPDDQFTMASEEKIDTAVKEPEAPTMFSSDDMLGLGDPVMINPEPTPVMTPINPEKEIVAPNFDLEPEPAPEPTPESAPEKPEEKVSSIGVEAVSTGNEFDDLLAWSERDTVVKVGKVQQIIDGLEARINNITRELESDTEGLSEDAKSLFEKNTKKNISLIRDQIAREKELQEVLNARKDAFISKLRTTLSEYGKPITVPEFKLKDDDKGDSDNSKHSDISVK